MLSSVARNCGRFQIAQNVRVKLPTFICGWSVTCLIFSTLFLPLYLIIQFIVGVLLLSSCVAHSWLQQWRCLRVRRRGGRCHGQFVCCHPVPGTRGWDRNADWHDLFADVILLFPAVRWPVGKSDYYESEQCIVNKWSQICQFYNHYRFQLHKVFFHSLYDICTFFYLLDVWCLMTEAKDGRGSRQVRHVFVIAGQWRAPQEAIQEGRVLQWRGRVWWWLGLPMLFVWMICASECFIVCGEFLPICRNFHSWQLVCSWGCEMLRCHM